MEEFLWREIDPTAVKLLGRQSTLPSEFKTFELNTRMMHALLANAAKGDDVAHQNVTEIELPLPEGVLTKYRVKESSSMQKALLEKYPQLRTYSGQGIDDASSTAKIDFMPGGFHGYILSTKGSVIIQPFSEGDTVHYISYYKQFSTEEKKAFELPADSLKKH